MQESTTNSSTTTSRSKKRRNRRKCRKIDTSNIEDDPEDSGDTTKKSHDEVENSVSDKTNCDLVVSSDGNRSRPRRECQKIDTSNIEEDQEDSGDPAKKSHDEIENSVSVNDLSVNDKTNCDLVLSSDGNGFRPISDFFSDGNRSRPLSDFVSDDIPTTLVKLTGGVVITDLDDDCVILGEIDIGSDEKLNRTSCESLGQVCSVSTIVIPETSVQKSESENELSTFKDYLLSKTSEQYRVDSPDLPKQKLATKKSRSLDEDDTGFKITEAVSSDSVNAPSECQAVISEVDSEVEWETAEELDVEEENSTLDLQDLSDTCDSEVLISDFQMENFDVLPVEITDFKTAEDDGKNKTDALNEMRIRRARKRAALESHFLPQLTNPRYLDVIQEESESSGSKRNSTDFLDFMRTNDEYDLDDDVFEDPDSYKARYKGPQEVMRNWTCGKFLNRETGEMMLVRGQDSANECLLLGTKLVDTEAPTSICSDWVKTNLQESFDEAPEVVYLEETPSSSTGSVNDDVDDSGGRFSPEFDIENVDLVLRGYDALTRKALAENKMTDEKGDKDKICTDYDEKGDKDKICTDYDEKGDKDKICIDYDETGIGVDKVVLLPDSEGSSRCSSRATCVPRMQSLEEEFTDQPNDCFAGGVGPTSLRTLCLRAIAAQPYGEDILQELAEVARNLDMNTRKECKRFVRDVKVTTPPVGMGRRLSTGSKSPPIGSEEGYQNFRRQSGPEEKNLMDLMSPIMTDDELASSEASRVPPRPDLIDLVTIKSPTPTNTKDQQWVLGVPTKSDPGVLMCLSKKQTEVKIEPNTADAILDLHEKYLERVTSPDFSAIPRRTLDHYETTRVENLYKSEILKTENSQSDGTDVMFRKTLKVGRILNTLLMTGLKGCSRMNC
ncbi:uncharacterized protein LOC113385223 [Ctenocephalides felis]|uniref:uncharacterized protein LOC113385223 n=1 Tax=Ctenocephalides felis TaxID=7515 RepID=UPI000E6E2B2B|nr:uncharacterized protein LOC113385223 [Ctenocephalides felis]